MRDVGYIDSHFIAGSDYRQITRRDYVGAFEFDADTLERTLLPEGFVTAADNALHIFIPDYQGNITGVYNSSANALEQFTDYYPYGLPHASATSPEVNTRKYGAKELTTDHGLNLYDFAARWQNPAFPRFTTPDPLAEKYFSISPFTYCAGDPINLIDPTGMDWKNEKDKQYLLDILNRRLKDLKNQIDNVTNEKNKRVEENKSTDKQDEKIKELNSQVEQINQAISDVNTLDNDPNNTYALMDVSGNGEHCVKKITGVIYIQYSDKALIFHELAHIRQSIQGHGLFFSDEGYLLNDSQNGKNDDDLKACVNEVKAYRIQYSVSSNSMPYPVYSLYNIKIEYLTHIRTPGGYMAYPKSEAVLKYIKNQFKEHNVWLEEMFYPLN